MSRAYELTDRKNVINRRSTRECLNILTADDFDIYSGRSGRIQFDALTAPFTVGQVVTGAGSGHTATIYAIFINADDPTIGYLAVNGADGIFQNNDVLSDPGGGAAAAVGALGPHTGLWMGLTVASAAVFAALTTEYEVKRNVAGHSFAASFKITADLRSIQLTSGVITAHKINES